MVKRALITGITGQDGSYLAELLLEKGYEVYGLIRRLSTPNTERIAHLVGQLHLVAGDMLDQSSLTLALDMAQPDEIYNLAAMSHVGESFKQPLACAEYNGLGALRLLEAIRLSGAPVRFYQASTSELFGNALESPQHENTPFAPCSPYATSKLFAHHSVCNYRDSYGLHASCGILFNHESPRRGHDFVTRKITRGIAEIKAGLRETLSLGNLNVYRDWGYAPDYVRAMWLMLQQETPDDYVIATGKTWNIAEFVAKACDYVNLPRVWHRYVEVDESLKRPADVSMLVGDANKARRVLGWEPTISFTHLVALMMEADLETVYAESQAGSQRAQSWAETRLEAL